MSLQIWLPLNGTLKNNGLGTISTTSGTLAFKSGGKIANTSYDLSKRYYINCPELANLQTFSVCFWGYIESSSTITSNWQDLIGFIDVDASGATGTFRWETCYANGGGTLAGIHWHDNPTNAFVNNSAHHNKAKNEWCHCCVVFNKEAGKIYSYSNGKLIATSDHLGGHFNSTGQFYLGENNNIAGKIQDVRFYDHALSPKEVKEISKGLCLHYKLSEPCENLCSNSRTFEGWTYYKDLDKNYTFNGAYSVSTTTAWTGPAINLKTYADTGIIKKDDILTYSIWVSSKYDISNACFTLYRSNADLGIDLNGKEARQRDINLIANKWVKIQQTFKVTDYSLTSTKMRYEYDAPTEKDENSDYSIPNHGIVYFALPKLEISSKATAWMPSKNDTLYAMLGYGTTEYDCSGYNNHGTKTDTITGNVNTARYDTSLYFPNKTKVYTLTGFPNMINPSFTLNFWFMPFSSFDYSNFADICGLQCTTTGQDDTLCRLEIFENNYYSWFRGFQITQSSLSAGILTKDAWNMITLASDGVKVYSYLNGVLVNSMDIIEWQPTGNFYLGDIAGSSGQYSDCRIYATALSVDDITELYKTSAIIDNGNNVYAYELKEE